MSGYHGYNGYVEPDWHNTLDCRNNKLYPTISSCMEAAKIGGYNFYLLANKLVYSLDGKQTNSCLHNGHMMSFP